MRKGDRPRENAAGPDCGSCIHRDGCTQAEEGRFCPRWQSQTPEPKGPDPNRLWETGEDAVF